VTIGSRWARHGRSPVSPRADQLPDQASADAEHGKPGPGGPCCWSRTPGGRRGYRGVAGRSFGYRSSQDDKRPEGGREGEAGEGAIGSSRQNEGPAEETGAGLARAQFASAITAGRWSRHRLQRNRHRGRREFRYCASRTARRREAARSPRDRRSCAPPKQTVRLRTPRRHLDGNESGRAEKIRVGGGQAAEKQPLERLRGKAFASLSTFKIDPDRS